MQPTKTKRTRINTAGIISRVSETNPKRANTLAFSRFALYQPGMTIAEYLAKGGRSTDVAYDAQHGFIEVQMPE
jgi:hypothetical protein